jgi:hypothetical protein
VSGLIVAEQRGEPSLAPNGGSVSDRVLARQRGWGTFRKPWELSEMADLGKKDALANH